MHLCRAVKMFIVPRAKLEIHGILEKTASALPARRPRNRLPIMPKRDAGHRHRRIVSGHRVVL